MIRAAIAMLLVAATFGAAACGDDEAPIARSTSTAAAPPTAPLLPSTTTTEPPHVRPSTTARRPAAPPRTRTSTTTATSPRTGPTLARLGISSDLEQEPVIPRPAGAPPTKLYVRDIVEGTGKKAKASDGVTVEYTGAAYSTGRQFASSWDVSELFQFEIGARMVVAGLDRGVVGMRTGGRRLVVIPPDMAYGAKGHDRIAPNETLIFVVDLVDISSRIS
jgi:peptidylprolyl isomerase